MMAGDILLPRQARAIANIGESCDFSLYILLIVSVRFIGGGDGLQNKFFSGSHPNFSSKDPKKFRPVRVSELELSLNTIGGYDEC